MVKRYPFLTGLAFVALSLIASVLWVAILPSKLDKVVQPQVLQAETDAMLAQLKPPKRSRPLVAVIGINDATETTDYLIPTGILRRADIAGVVTRSTDPGAIKLYPALVVEADETIEAFDMLHPDGADYVIVPAMSQDNDPALVTWLRNQAGKLIDLRPAKALNRALHDIAARYGQDTANVVAMQL